jgi:hypothetical protein
MKDEIKKAKELLEKEGYEIKKARLSEREKNNILELRENILGAFIWKETFQGHRYWEKVHENLKRLLE